MTHPTIALCMIVRDESAVIERCLASVRNLIDTWVICDTGSVDDTPARIEAALDGIPGELHQHEWRNFGYNRSELMELARGSADYLLLLDADMTLVHRSALPELAADAYLVRHTGDLDYAVPRLVRGDRAWRFDGATHEYLAADEPYRQERLDALIIEHHADGGSRADKLERDRALLEAELAERPDDGRTLFYLAQTYKDMGDRDRAIELYRRRVAAGGWDEEVFYAQYQVGVMTAEVDWDAAVHELLHAWQLRPKRAEPLHELARGYRIRGQHPLAQLFATAGLAVPYPDDLLFVHRDVYAWSLRFERSIAAYWSGDAETALADNDVLLEHGVPAYVEPWVLENRQWCLRALGRGSGATPSVLDAAALPLLIDLVPHTRIDGIVVSLDEGWNALNPSIAADGDGYRMILRTVNYDLLADGRYDIHDPGDVVRTRNFLLRLDAGLRVVERAELPAVPNGPTVHAGLVMGLEDCRLIELGDRWYAGSTVRDRSPEMLCEMALVTLADADVDRMVLMSTPDPSRYEKNWMPFLRDGALHFLYSCAPTIVLRCDPTTGALETVSSQAAPDVALGFRGGSQGLPVDDGWLFVIHETAFVQGVARAYTHRIVHLDHTLRLDRISQPFVFLGAGVEFCAGMARQGDEVVLTFGAADAGAYAARLPFNQLVGLLDPVP